MAHLGRCDLHRSRNRCHVRLVRRPSFGLALHWLGGPDVLPFLQLQQIHSRHVCLYFQVGRKSRHFMLRN